MNALRVKKQGLTAKVYRFEDELLSTLNLLDTGLAHLEDVLDQLWASSTCLLSYPPTPRLRFGRGVQQRGKWLSYASVDSQNRPSIVLAKGERNRVILLHEAAHCFGHWDHGLGFQQAYLGLLMQDVYIAAVVDTAYVIKLALSHRLCIPRKEGHHAA